MDIQTIFSTLSLLGVGGIIGSYLRALWDQRRETKLKNREINENKYQSTLVFMRCVLDPESIEEFNIDDPRVLDIKKADKETVREFAKKRLREFYFNSLLYSSDEVLVTFKSFLQNPSEENFFKTAVVMRKDLWGKTKINIERLSLK